MDVEDFANNVEELIDRAIADFEKDVITSQNGMYNRLSAILSRLELDNTGLIKTNRANLSILNSLRRELQNVIITDAYQKRVSSFINSFQEVKVLNDSYYLTAPKAFNPNKNLYKILINDAIEVTGNSLLEAGINERVIQPAREMIRQGITSGAQYADLLENIRIEIKGIKDKAGEPERLGRLHRYTKQITTDSLNQYSANYNKAITDDLKLNKYYYSGGLKTTSRSYCKKRAGKYFTKEEIEQSASQRWDGKITGTNESTIFIYRGGYNCNHQYYGVW